MKIVILLLNQGRGSGEVARQHARHLLQRGHEVFLVHPRVRPEIEGATHVDIELHTDVVPVHEYLPAAGKKQKAVSTMTREEALAYLPAYERALESVVPSSDAIIGHHANLGAIAVHDVARRHGKPYVLFLHGTGIEPRHHGGYDDAVWHRIRESIQQADGLLVTTDYVRDELVLPLVEVPPDRFLVLPCGVDLEQFRPDNVEGIREKYDLPDPYVICPGALTAVKGPQNVVAASGCYADLATTVFIGAGELRERLAADAGDRARFLGFVPDQDKARLVNAATVLAAAPEKKEHFGIIYAEALAGGTVPVAYEGGGVPSIVTPEVGVLTERSPEALGGEIRKMLSDPTRRRRMALAGRTRAERLYSYPDLVSRLERWLAEVSDRAE